MAALEAWIDRTHEDSSGGGRLTLCRPLSDGCPCWRRGAGPPLDPDAAGYDPRQLRELIRGIEGAAEALDELFPGEL